MTSGKEPYESPTVKRRRLGSELRRLRLASRMTCERVAEDMGWSTSKVSRMENARVHVSPADVDALLLRYGVGEDDRKVLIQLALDAENKGWWHNYSDVFPDWFSVFLGLEAEASSIQTYEAEVIPGLLQTEEYARAVLGAHPTPDTPDEIDRAVELRLDRQHRLTGPNPLRVHAIVNEAALRRTIGGRDVLDEQLNKLIDLSDLPNVTIQVLPFTAGVHPGLAGGFEIMEFPNPDDPRVVYLDNLTSALYLERLKEVGRYRLSFDKMREAALPPDESIEFVNKVACEAD